MRITTVLNIANIVIGMDGTDKDNIIDQMVDLAARNCGQIVPDDVKTAVKQREILRSTGFGKECAIPMGFCDKLHTIIMSVAILKQPVDWGSADNRPVRIVALISAPKSMIHDYMHTLKGISKILANDHLRTLILEQKTIQDIYSIIKANDRPVSDK